MDTLMKMLNIYHTYDNVKIYIDGYKKYNGYGLLLGDYVLTVYHVIENAGTIIINDEEYNILLFIDEYDIAVLSKKKSVQNIFSFLNIFKKFIDKNCIKIKDISKYVDEPFILERNLSFQFLEVIHMHPKTNIFPSIPIYSFKKNINSFDYAGFSGHPIKYYNTNTCLLISERLSTQQILGIPYEIIYKLIDIYIQNKKQFCYLPLILDEKSIVINNFRNISKNDIITHLNNKELINNTIFDSDLEINLMYDTYILMNGFNFVDITLYRTVKKIKKEYKINVKTKYLNYKDFSLNYKDTKLSTICSSIELSELSEEYLIECISNGIKIPDIDYNNIYNKKKLIVLKHIHNDMIKNEFLKKGLDISSNVYILNKISGKNIKHIEEVIQYSKFNRLTFELIDDKHRKIKIKI
jgi:hypothetical protein